MKIEVGSVWVNDEDISINLVVRGVEENEGFYRVRYQKYSDIFCVGIDICRKDEFLTKNTPKNINEYNRGFKEGFKQACKEFAEEGDDFWDDEDELEAGEQEENYCFIKDLQKVLDEEYEHLENPMPDERKHSHYFKDVRHLDYVDVYQICKLFPVDDDSGAIVHARKKLLVAGGRGAGKDMIKDITEARDTLSRYLQIEGYE